MWKLCSNLSCAAGLLAVAAHAADVAAPAANGRTDITAQKITMRNQENKAIFEGNVVLRKGALVVYSDMMVVFLKPGGSKPDEIASRAARKGADELPTVSNRTVSRIEATGQVRIEKADGRATGRKAVYNEDERKIVLTGDPVAWQRGTCVSGQKIVMFLDDDRTIVEGGSRVMIESETGGQPPAVCAK